MENESESEKNIAVETAQSLVYSWIIFWDQYRNGILKSAGNHMFCEMQEVSPQKDLTYIQYIGETDIRFASNYCLIILLELLILQTFNLGWVM